MDLRRDASPGELKRLVGAVLARPAEAVSLLPAGTAPFRGLEYFDVEHAHLFFGRDAETEALVAKLRADRFLAVVGASGSGKSSLVRAGLVPALHRGRFHDGRSWAVPWRIAVFRPGDRPFRELAAALPDLDPALPPAERIRVVGQCRAELERGDEGLETCLAALVPPGQHTLLVVDQLEELFTHGSRPEERRRFVDALLRVTQGGGARPVYVLATLRADFYSRCWEHPELPPRIALNQHAIRPLLRAEAREVVEKPLALAGASFEPGLVDRILDEAGDEPGTLPLVEHALLQLWERRRGRVLTHAAYDEIGGIGGALAHHADAVFERLEDEEERRIAEKVFLRLTSPGEGTEDTRRRAARDEVIELGADEAVAERVLGSLTASRLVVTRREGESDVVEVAHEALIREWPRLRGWIDSQRAAIRVERRLLDAAAEWERLGRDEDALLRGVPLAEAEQWAREHGDDLRPREREFVVASVEARDQAAREAEERRNRELETARQLSEAAVARAETDRRATRQARRSLGLVMIALLAAVMAAGYAAAKSVESGRRAAEAESRQLAARAEATLPHDPSEALLLAIQATQRAPTFEATDVLRRALDAPTARALLSGLDIYFNAVFSSDGRRVAAGSNSAVHVWDVATGRATLILRGHQGIVLTATFSGDGLRLVTAGSDATVRVWDLRTGQGTIILRGHLVRTATFSPDGQRVVTAGADGTHVWHLATGRTTRILRGRSIAAFSPDGLSVITVDEGGTARAWGLDGSQASATILSEKLVVSAAAFSPDGRRVVTASEDDSVRIWDLATGARLHALLHGHDRLYSVAFSPDGQRVATAGGNGTALIWDLATRQAADTLRGHEGGVYSVAFSRDGRLVVTAGVDGTVRVWDLTVGPATRTVRRASDARDVALSPGGRLAVTTSGAAAHVWEVATGRSVRTLDGRQHKLSALAFSPDGRRVVTGGASTVLAWDLTTGQATDTLRGHGDRVVAAAFTSDGRRVITTSGDATARVWDLETGRATVVLRRRDEWNRVVFSPDGRRAVVILDDVVEIWDVAADRVIDTLPGHRYRVAAFSPDGRRIVMAGGDDGSARVWDAETRRPLSVLKGHRGRISAVAFSQDGRQIVTGGGEDRTARTWDAETGSPLAVLHGLDFRAGGAAFSSDGRHVVIVGFHGTVHRFILDPDELLKVARARLPVTLAPARRDSLLGRQGRR